MRSRVKQVPGGTGQAFSSILLALAICLLPLPFFFSRFGYSTVTVIFTPRQNVLEVVSHINNGVDIFIFPFSFISTC